MKLVSLDTTCKRNFENVHAYALASPVEEVIEISCFVTTVHEIEIDYSTRYNECSGQTKDRQPFSLHPLSITAIEK